ncbi:MAG: GGDEF domain-containing protein [Gammaproteobacteria bacterium]|nr:GGDEF domain-containing protein [Gammaproteobacteria bacterium]
MLSYLKRARWLILLWRTVLFCLLLPTAQAATLVGDQDEIPLFDAYHYFEDSATTTPFNEIQQHSEFTAGRLQPNFGYSTSAYWLRMELLVEGNAKSVERLLEIAFPTLDYLEVYLLKSSNSEILYQAQAGDQLPFSSRPIDHRNFIFPLTLPTNEPLSLYIKVQSNGSLTVPAYLWKERALLQQSRDNYVLFAVYFGILLALFIYNLLLYLSLRDRVYLYYILFVAAMAVGQGSWQGYFQQYFWPHWPTWGNIAAICGFSASGFFGAIFSRRFLATATVAPRMDKLLLGCAIAFLSLLLGAFVIPYREVAIATSLAGVLFAVIAVSAGIVCLLRKNASARYFLIAWAVLLLGVAAMGMRNLGWIPSNLLTFYALQIGSALEMLLLSFALADRINQMRRKKDAAESEALQTRQQMLELLSNTEIALEAKVAQRTAKLHEVNQQLRLQQEYLHNLAHHDPLTGLANRLLLAERIDRTLKAARRQKRHFALLIFDLDGFKEINDLYGHAIGDNVLQIVANRLQQSLRESDTAARTGGDEFVVLLDMVNSVTVATEIAGNLAALVSGEMVIAHLQLKVGVSIGVAVYPEDGEEAKTLLAVADQQMYLVKAHHHAEQAIRAGSATPHK